jgi:hypothetical protein
MLDDFLIAKEPSGPSLVLCMLQMPHLSYYASKFCMSKKMARDIFELNLYHINITAHSALSSYHIAPILVSHDIRLTHIDILLVLVL